MESEEEEEISCQESDNEGNGVTPLDALMNYALTLNVEGTLNLRATRTGEGTMEIKKRRQADEIARKDIALTACLLGYNHPLRSWAEKEKIAQAASKLVSYDQGYKKVTRSLHRWISNYTNALTSIGSQVALRSNNKGRKSYVSKIEARHPTYLHSLYRYATSVLGDGATFEEMAQIMNKKCATEGEPEVLALSEWQVRRWWKNKGGKERSS